MHMVEKELEDLAMDIESQKEEEDNKKGNTGINIAAGYAAAESARNSTQKAIQKYAKPDTYTGNRNLFDSGMAKKKAKDDLFTNNNNEVLDPYTGEKLVPKIKKAKEIYGEDWTEHLAETDHIKPLEKVYEETKNNPWLSTEDVKDIGNGKGNIRVISRKTNNAKRSRTNKDFIKDKEYRDSKGANVSKQGEKRALRDGQQAEVYTRGREIIRTGENILHDGHEAGMAGAKSAATSAVAMSGILNTVAVLRGEKEAGEAIVDTMEDGGKAAVTGYVMSDGLMVVSNSLSGSSSKFLQALSKSNVPGKIITAVMTVGGTLKRYGNGEISTQQCIIELGDKALNLTTAGYSALVGQTLIPIPIVGSAIGALVGATLTSGLYHNLVNVLQSKDLEHEERMRIIAECREAAEQARAFRAELESYLNDYFSDYRDCFDEALSEMNFAFQIGDLEGVIAGANQITRKLGGQVHYETVNQFKSFLNDNSIDIL